MYKFIHYLGNVDSDKLRKRLKFLEPLSEKDILHINSIFNGWDYELVDEYSYPIHKFCIENEGFLCRGG
jgi:hypothetical protein